MFVPPIAIGIVNAVIHFNVLVLVLCLLWSKRNAIEAKEAPTKNETSRTKETTHTASVLQVLVFVLPAIAVFINIFLAAAGKCEANPAKIIVKDD